jgi:hypothetical protein
VLDVCGLDHSGFDQVVIGTPIAEICVACREHIARPTGILSECQAEPKKSATREACDGGGIDPARLVAAMVQQREHGNPPAASNPQD